MSQEASKLMGRVIVAGTDDTIYKWRDCPDCKGRGYFVVNPFAPCWERRQCVTCETAFKANAAQSNAGVNPVEGKSHDRS